MRKLNYLLIFIFSFSVLSAQEKLSKEEKARREKNIQAGNPFVKYGCKAPVATLSKGKYLEVHDLDSIVTIGTMRWHVDKNQIVGRILQDTLNVDAQPIGDAPGMWMSPDPLSEEFPSYSPYNFCLGNPLRLVDSDGKAPNDFTILIAKDGAQGSGHMAGIIQDGKGNYYYVTMGATESAGLSKMSSEGVQGGMTLQKLDGAKNMNEAISMAKTDSSNSSYTDQITFKTNSKTDQAIFDKTSEKADAVNSGKEKYNLLSNNCTDAVERPIEQATGVSLPDGAKPNSNFSDLKSDKGVIQSAISTSENRIDNAKIKNDRSLMQPVKDVTNVTTR